MNIVILSGSPRGNSVTHRLALHLQKVLQKETEHDTQIIDCREIDLPQLQTIFTSIDEAPEEYRDVARLMFGADAFIFVTPEYNGSYPAALKNLMDHFPKQHHKVFAIATASPGGLGGIRAALQLQELVYALFGIGSPYMLVTPQIDKKFDPSGKLLDETFRKPVELFIREFLWLAEKIVDEKVNA